MAVRIGALPLQIEFDAPVAVREALDALGRTEDVRLAPGGHRLAIACYADAKIAVAKLEITASGSPPEVTVSSIDILASPVLREPHGIEFVDDDTLLVGNRVGGIAALRLPPTGEGHTTPAAASESRQLPLLEVPGSLAVHSNASGGRDLLVCNNGASTITRHPLDQNGVPTGGAVIARRWLDIPDGIAISHDGEWLAVSNHNTHSVFVYSYPTLGEQADPVCILRGIHYPHGLRFGADARYLVVADAGAPYIHVFLRPSSEWVGVAYPALSVRVMNDETFVRGRHNPQEGGPKGIDVHRSTGVLAVTSELLPLAFFDIEAALERGTPGHAAAALVRYELDALAERERREAELGEARAMLTEFQQTKAWRLTSPLRRAHETAARLKRRRAG